MPGVAGCGDPGNGATDGADGAGDTLQPPAGDVGAPDSLTDPWTVGGGGRGGGSSGGGSDGTTGPPGDAAAGDGDAVRPPGDAADSVADGAGADSAGPVHADAPSQDVPAPGGADALEPADVAPDAAPDADADPTPDDTVADANDAYDALDAADDVPDADPACPQDGLACDDGDPCTADDTCHGGQCVGGPSPCDDGDACNGWEVCHEDGTCQAGTPQACDDGNPCNGVEFCDPLYGCVLGPPVLCSDGDACNGLEVCDPFFGGCVKGEPPACDDGSVCTGAESCSPTTGCVAGVALVCDDGNLCNGAESCDALDGCKPGVPLFCSDDDACNGLETCAPATGCKPGTPPVCDDGDACNGLETCDAAAGCLNPADLACDDGDPCNGFETCAPLVGCVAGGALDCGLYGCSAAGCLTSCSAEIACGAGAFCDTPDTDGDGDTSECLATLPDGAACTFDQADFCASGWCHSGLCCAGGVCCNSDSTCPVSSQLVDQAQTQASPTNTFARVFVTETSWGAQTFVPSVSGPLTRVRINLWGTVGLTLGVKIDIFKGSLPNAAGAVHLVDKTFFMTNVSPAEPQPYDAIFYAPAELEAGETYVIQVSGQGFPTTCGPGCTPWAVWHGAGDNPYPAGSIYRSYDSGGSWDSTPWDDDMWFEVWMGERKCVDHQCLTPPT